MSNNALTSGTFPKNDRSLANVARILGIVILVLNCLWLILGGGMATLGALNGGGRPPATTQFPR